LPISDGVIVNLGAAVLDTDHLENGPNRFFLHLLKSFINSAREAHLPLVFALEDIRDTFDTVEEYIEKTKLGWHVETKPAKIITLNDDIWHRSSPTIQFLRETLNISATVPVLPYSYRKPISIQNILTTLLTEIDKNQPASGNP
jgi:hypothetical protein